MVLVVTAVQAGHQKVRARTRLHLHPEQLQKLVRASIESFTDMSEYDENAEKETLDIDTIDDLKVNVENYINHKVYELGI